MKRLCLFLLLISFSLLSKASDPFPYKRQPYTPAEYLKNYAIIVCFHNAYPDDKTIAQDLLDASTAYRELGSLSIDAYNETYELSKKFLARKYVGINGEKLTAMKCIDFFHSKELNALVKKYEKIRNSQK